MANFNFHNFLIDLAVQNNLDQDVVMDLWKSGCNGATLKCIQSFSKNHPGENWQTSKIYATMYIHPLDLIAFFNELEQKYGCDKSTMRKTWRKQCPNASCIPYPI